MVVMYGKECERDGVVVLAGRDENMTIGRERTAWRRKGQGMAFGGSGNGTMFVMVVLS